MEKLLLALGAVALLGATLFMTQTGHADLKMNNLGAIDPQVVDLYGDWKKTYNKKYATPDQDWYRLTVFNENYQMIKEFYEGPEQTYTLDFNLFMDLTPQEFAETYLTLQVSEVPEYNDVYEVPENGAVDWVSRGAVPPVKNQASCGSCWAFSAVGALESHTRIVYGESVNLSEQELVDCSKRYGNNGCNGGLMENAFKYVRDNGIASQSAYPYTAREGTCRTVSKVLDIQGSKSFNTCSKVGSALQDGPISVAVDATNWQFYSGGVFTNCSNGLNHGVLLVGIDSSSQWKIRNSWGPSWGESGYIRLASGDTCGVCEVASQPVM